MESPLTLRIDRVDIVPLQILKSLWFVRLYRTTFPEATKNLRFQELVGNEYGLFFFLSTC